MDEPVANLDPETRYKYFSALKKLNKENGVAIIISSHILTELNDFINGMIVLKEGKLVKQQKVNDKENITKIYNAILDIEQRSDYE